MSMWKMRRHEDGSTTWEAFGQFKVEQALEKIDPAAKAREFVASSDTKDFDDSTLTDQEIQLLAYPNEYISELQEFYNARIAQVRQTILEYREFVSLKDRFSDLEDKFKASVGRKKRAFLTENERELSDMEDARDALRIFQSEHTACKGRMCSYPESQLEHFSSLFLFLLFEAFLNSFFFAEASGLGLLGGYVEATIISAVNVALSATMGYWLRYMNHKDAWRRMAAVAGFSIGVLFLVVLHLGTAHYREWLSELDPLAPVEASSRVVGAFESMWSDPWAITDFQSFALIVVGVLISIFAIRKGYRADDAYPGYGDVHRKWKEHEERFLALFAQLREAVEESYNDLVEDVAELRKGISSARRELSDLDGHIQRHFLTCDTYYAGARQGAMTLLSAFRSEVRFIIDSEERFQLHEELLDEKQNGLIPLDPSLARNEAMALYEETGKELENAYSNFETERDAFFDRMSAVLDEEKSDLEKEWEKFDRLRKGNVDGQEESNMGDVRA